MDRSELKVRLPLQNRALLFSFLITECNFSRQSAVLLTAMKTLIAVLRRSFSAVGISIFLFSFQSFSQKEEYPQINATPIDTCTVYLSSVAHSGYGCLLCYDYNWGVVTDCEFADFSLAIYNRWGLLVYEFENQEDRWFSLNQDGNVVPQGAYYWLLSYTDHNGHEVKRTGHVTVMR